MLIGIDVGTQSLKAVVTDHELDVKVTASQHYQPSFPQLNHAEQDPRIWERALGPAIAEALDASGVRASQIAAVGLCGQLDGCIPVDRDGAPQGNCLIWMDRRAVQEFDNVALDHLHKVTGIVADASHLAAKIRWLKRHRKQSGSRLRYHQPVSYMVERLTKCSVIDHALASTSMVYGLKARRYDEKLLAAFEILEGELAPIAEAHDCAGKLSRHGSELTGLPTEIPVAVGTGDDFSTVLGAGLSAQGQVSVAVGTGEVVGSIFTEPIIDEGKLVETHAYPGGGYFIENPGWLSGGSVKWLSTLLNIGSWEAFDALASKAPAGSEGIIFIPALTGAMSPEWIPGVKGCFYGLTPAHNATHMTRAVLEGCSFAMRDVIDRLRSLGARPSSITFLAGGSHSELWGQIRSDVSGLPLSLPRHNHTSPLGAAMLAGVAGQIFSRLADAAAFLPLPLRQLQPNPTASTRLEQFYQNYRRLFEALKPLAYEHA